MRQLAYMLLALLCCLGCLQPDPAPVTPVDPAPVVDNRPSGPLKVLIKYESDPKVFRQLPASQVAQIQGPQLRKWFADNKAEWRIWDKDTDVTYAPKFWQDAMKLPAEKLPWIWSSNGKDGFNGELPLTGDETIKLLEGVK